MKREFYKLILVAIMVLFAFSLGFFLGREVTLTNPNPDTHNNQSTQQRELNKKPSVSNTQRERVNQYKQNHLNKNRLLSRQQRTSKNKAPHHSPHFQTSSKTPSTANQEIKTGLLKENNKPTNQALTTNHTAEDKGLKNTGQVQKKQEKPANTLYALQIKSHKNRREAIKQSTDLKLRFPKWRFFFKQTGKTYTVYIGPFKFKRSAQRALRKLKIKKGFASTRIEKL